MAAAIRPSRRPPRVEPLRLENRLDQPGHVVVREAGPDGGGDLVLRSLGQVEALCALAALTGFTPRLSVRDAVRDLLAAVPT